MKNILKKLWEKIDGWKTIISLLGCVLAYFLHYKWNIIGEQLFEEVVTYLLGLSAIFTAHHFKVIKDILNGILGIKEEEVEKEEAEDKVEDNKK
jgi:hypothetical protein